MAIDKAKFFHQFQLETSEHLSNLYRGLTHLQMNQHDNGAVKMLMTDAHTISGTSGMMGLHDISVIARSLENGFMKVLQRAGEINALQFNVSYSALLSIATIMDEQTRSIEGETGYLDAGLLCEKINEAFTDISAQSEEVVATEAGKTRSPQGRVCGPGDNIAVLLVDDAPVITAFGKEMLETAGYKVFVAGDGEEALYLLGNLDVTG